MSVVQDLLSRVLSGLLVFLVSSLLLTGCVSKPLMEVYGVHVQSATPAGVVLNMRLKVNNKNAFDVKVRGVRVQVTIAEKYSLPVIAHNPDKWLASNGSTLVDVPVSVPWTMVTPLLATTAGSNEIDYHVSGSADVTAVRALGIEVDDYEVDEDGTVSRAELVIAAARGVLR